MRYLLSQSSCASSIARRSAITAAARLAAQGQGAPGQLVDRVLSSQDLGLVETEFCLHVGTREQEQGRRADTVPAVGKRPLLGKAGVWACSRLATPTPNQRTARRTIRP